jgi:polyhydroxyalkanoate synthesis repressor PhaR
VAKGAGPGGEGAETEPVRITRYPNRRLYDRSRGRYVTLPEVADLIRSGGNVVVQDSKTGEDLTRVVLTQILLERYPERMELFPVAVLHHMIRANDAVLGFFREYLRQSLAYLQAWQQTAGAVPLGTPLDWMRALLPVPPPVPGPPADTEALTRRLAEMERRLAELETTAKPRPEAGRGRPRPAPDGP